MAAVRGVAPDAAGKPVFVIEAAATIVKAFLQAAIWSVASITLILFIVLRRWSHVALTLVPLLVAIVVTLEICVAIGLQLNFANIIALPLLLGVGVAFKIYYIMAWRSGERNFLQSSLDAGCHLQRLYDRDRFREPVVLAPPGYIEHGQTDGSMPRDDACSSRALPTRAFGDTEQGRWEQINALKLGSVTKK